MTRVIQWWTAAASTLYFALSLFGTSLAAGANRESVEKPLNLQPPPPSRAPASVNPMLESPTRQVQRPGVSILQATHAPHAPWRVLGTCRQDIGRQSSANGMGYADCTR
ncbi:MAG: hypothetical protein RJB38_1164 [Pseudomonadota bacterium]|jgi:hypothetical protein